MTLSRNNYMAIAIASLAGTNGVITSNGGAISVISGTTVTTTDRITRIELDNVGTVAGEVTVNNMTFPVPSGRIFNLDFAPTSTISISISGNFNAILLG